MGLIVSLYTFTMGMSKNEMLTNLTTEPMRCRRHHAQLTDPHFCLQGSHDEEISVQILPIWLQ
jgi:hypothetical protein